MIVRPSREDLARISEGFSPEPGQSYSLKAEAYTEPYWADVERDAIFRRNWQRVCHAEKLREPGASGAVDIAGQPADGFEFLGVAGPLRDVPQALIYGLAFSKCSQKQTGTDKHEDTAPEEDLGDHRLYVEERQLVAHQRDEEQGVTRQEETDQYAQEDPPAT